MKNKENPSQLNGSTLGKIGIILQLIGCLLTLIFISFATHFTIWRGGFFLEASLYLLFSIFGVLGFIFGLLSIFRTMRFNRSTNLCGKYTWDIFPIFISLIFLITAIRFAFSSQSSSDQISSSQLSIQSPRLPTSVILPISDRLQDPECPLAGWCGEASIQMGMGYYHKEIPQRIISLAGKPGDHELYYYNIDTALSALGVNYIVWNGYKKNIPMFIDWIKSNLAKGYPVLCGVKMYPTYSPWWPLDHFVLIVGYNESGLIVNTNQRGYRQILIEYSKLSSTSNRYTFVNKYHCYFGRALTGVKQ